MICQVRVAMTTENKQKMSRATSSLLIKIAVFLLSQCTFSSADFFTNPSECKISEYYDTVEFKCLQCPLNSLASADQLSCRCRQGFYSVFDDKQNKLFCDDCEFKDAIVCITSSSACDPISIKTLEKRNGSLQVQCLACPYFYRPNADQSGCVLCSDHVTGESGGCNCPPDFEKSAGLCIRKTDFSAIPNVPSLSLVRFNGNYIESAWMKRYVHAMAAACKVMLNMKSCQHLANLCALIAYNFDNINACSLYRQLMGSVKSSGGREEIPALYFDESTNPQLLNQQKVPWSFGKTKDKELKFFCAVFALDGTFIKTESLADVLQNFYHTSNNNGLLTGNNLKRNLLLSIETFQNQDNIFLDLFLRYRESNGSWKVIPIPLRVLNYSRGGMYRNQERDPLRWQLVKRFFLKDAVSSKSTDNSTAPFWQYLSSLTLTFRVIHGEGSTQYVVPYASLTYGVVDTQSVRKGDRFSLELRAEYVGETQDSIQALEITLSVLSSLCAVYALFRTFVWYQRSDSSTVDIVTLVRFVCKASSALADVFFVVVFLTGFYWLVTYRNQSDFFLTLPNPWEEKFIADVMISAFVLKVVTVLVLIMDQCNIDIFFIDWEKPKPGGSKSDANSVSVWRSYFVANEWNELQTIRRISVPLQTVLVLFILEVFDVKKFAFISSGPTSANDGSDVEYNRALRFALGLLVFLTVAMVQMLFNALFYERFVEHKIQRFIDLCSLTNISVWILAHSRFGYYIHGRSPHGFADTDMQTMVSQLKREEENLCAHRGLLQGTNLQTFTILLDPKITAAWKRLSYPLNYSNHVLQGSTENSNSDAYGNLNKFFTAFLDHALSDVDYEVYDRYFLETMANCETREAVNKTVFFNDPKHTFHDVLFYGNEKDLILLDLLLFGLVELFTQNYTAALLTNYLVYQVLKWLRYQYGRRNLARKTLIDSRFLF